MILITGAMGFVGSYCISELSNFNDVLQLNRKGVDDRHHIIADLTREDTLKRIRSLDVDVLVHLASAIPGRDSGYFNTNVIGTYNLLKNIDRKHLKKVILLSSVSVYRNASNLDTVYQEDNYDFTEDEYGRSKLSQEMLVRTFCGDTIDHLIFRASSIYGPGNTSKTLLPIFFQRASNNEDLVIQVHNYQQNFVHVRDVANVIRQGIEKGLAGTYNLFSCETVTIEELASIVLRVVGSSSRVVEDYKSEQHYRKVYNNSKLLRDFDCNSFTTLEEGIKSLGEPCYG